MSSYASWEKNMDSLTKLSSIANTPAGEISMAVVNLFPEETLDSLIVGELAQTIVWIEADDATLGVYLRENIPNVSYSLSLRLGLDALSDDITGVLNKEIETAITTLYGV